MENRIHEPLEGGWGIGETKWHNLEGKATSRSDEGSLPLIFMDNPNFKVAWVSITHSVQFMTCNKNTIQSLFYIILLFIINTLYFSPTFFSSLSLLPSPASTDIFMQFVYWREFAVESIRGGEFPLWNPLLYCGNPFFGNFQSALLYPLNAIYLLFPLHTAFTADHLIHLFLFSLFFYLLEGRLGPTKLFSGMDTHGHSKPNLSLLLLLFFHDNSGHVPLAVDHDLCQGVASLFCADKKDRLPIPGLILMAP